MNRFRLLYHPLYITSDREGGYGNKNQYERERETIYAGVKNGMMEKSTHPPTYISKVYNKFRQSMVSWGRDLCSTPSVAAAPVSVETTRCRPRKLPRETAAVIQGF